MAFSTVCLPTLFPWENKKGLGVYLLGRSPKGRVSQAKNPQSTKQRVGSFTQDRASPLGQDTLQYVGPTLVHICETEQGIKCATIFSLDAQTEKNHIVPVLTHVQSGDVNLQQTQHVIIIPFKSLKY